MHARQRRQLAANGIVSSIDNLHSPPPPPTIADKSGSCCSGSTSDTMKNHAKQVQRSHLQAQQQQLDAQHKQHTSTSLNASSSASPGAISSTSTTRNHGCEHPPPTHGRAVLLLNRALDGCNGTATTQYTGIFRDSTACGCGGYATDDQCGYAQTAPFVACRSS